MEGPEWTVLPDLASRRAGGGVVWADDELFAERENLIKPGRPVFQPGIFGHKGQLYDGWETRRRREPGCDRAIVRLGLPGAVTGVVVDTSFFTGNHPPFASVEALAVPGYPSPVELSEMDWDTIVGRSPLAGDAENFFPVTSGRRYTHARLTIYPDGGVARFRVHGTPIADPSLLDPDALDLAALENGARVTEASNMFYGSSANLIAPGYATVMGEGWETARRRDDGNDWVIVELAAEGLPRFAELDTTHFKGNAPGWAALSGKSDGEWTEVLPRTRLQPDTRHRFRVEDARAVTHLRLDIYPDGGMARLRLFGALTPTGRETLTRRFHDAEAG